ncbi:MAG TPA: WhiB family transcriptional regulator [Acidimicrobiales bacterium]|jgi:WhiB family redox-sensing transcriptional regulator|nr:WhiB family transcriptional regulator [Acidimicrobiales bacterium]
MATTSVDWSSAAACRGSEGSLFYSADSAERKEDRVERELLAKRICAGCGVREECLRAALDRHETYGIWGGLNEFERRALTRVV